jgi:hypothetical protein
VSERQLKRAKLLGILEEHGLLESFLEAEYPDGFDTPIRAHLRRLEHVRSLMEKYDGPVITTRSLREAEKAALDELRSQTRRLTVELEAGRRDSPGTRGSSAHARSRLISARSLTATVLGVSLFVLVLAALISGGSTGDQTGTRTGSSSGDMCAQEGGVLRRWVSIDGSQVFTSDPHRADVNEIGVCAQTGRPVSINGHPY